MNSIYESIFNGIRWVLDILMGILEFGVACADANGAVFGMVLFAIFFTFCHIFILVPDALQNALIPRAQVIRNCIVHYLIFLVIWAFATGFVLYVSELPDGI